MPKTTHTKLGEWFDAGVEAKADYLIIVVDTFSFESYPVYVQNGGEKTVHEEAQALESASMSRVMEVYDLHADKEAQIQAGRAWAIPKPQPGASTKSVNNLLKFLKRYAAAVVKLRVAVPSSSRDGHTHQVGTEVLLVAPIDPDERYWIVEVRVPDDQLEGGAWFESLEMRVEDLELASPEVTDESPPRRV